MRIAALDCVWYDLPLEARLKHMAELGFEGVEFWLTTAELGFDVPWEWPPSHEPARLALSAKSLAKIARKAGVEIVAFGQYALLGHYPTPAEPPEVEMGRRRERIIEDVKALLGYAAETEGKIVIAESGGDPDKPEHWEPLVEVTQELVSHAEEVGAILAIENTPQMHVSTDDRLLRLMREIDSKALRVLYDPANFNLTPPSEWDLLGAIRKLKDYLILVHAKDSIYHEGPYGKMPGGSWDCPPIGKGAVPWKGCWEVLKEVGYDGYLILEYAYATPGELEDRDRAAIDGKNYLERLIGEPSSDRETSISRL